MSVYALGSIYSEYVYRQSVRVYIHKECANQLVQTSGPAVCNNSRHVCFSSLISYWNRSREERVLVNVNCCTNCPEHSTAFRSSPGVSTDQIIFEVDRHLASHHFSNHVNQIFARPAL